MTDLRRHALASADACGVTASAPAAAAAGANISSAEPGFADSLCGSAEEPFAAAGDASCPGDPNPPEVTGANSEPRTP